MSDERPPLALAGQAADVVEHALPGGWQELAALLVEAEKSHPVWVREALDALGRAQHQDAAMALAAFRDRSCVKRLRKAAGRSLALLSARGISAGAPSGGDAETEREHAQEGLRASVPYRTASFRRTRITPELHALVSGYDSAGQRLLLVPVATGPGAPLAAVVVARLDGPGALVGASVEPMSRAQFARLLEPSGVRPFERMVAVPLEYGRHLLQQGVARAQRAGREASAKDREAVQRAGAPSRGFERPLVFEAAPDVVRHAQEHLGELLRSGERLAESEQVWPWAPWGQLEPEASLARTLQEGRLELPGTAGRHWAPVVIGRGVSRLYGASDVRAEYAQRLFELAYRLWVEGEDEQAARAVAAGLALEDPARHVSEVGVLRALVGAVLSSCLEGRGAGERAGAAAEGEGRLGSAWQRSGRIIVPRGIPPS